MATTWLDHPTFSSNCRNRSSAGLGADFQELHIVGAAVVDTLGDHTPPRRLPSGAKKRRQKLAYVSNVAVAGSARRQGIAAALLRESEKVRVYTMSVPFRTQ